MATNLEGSTDARSLDFATFTRAALKGWKTDDVFKPYYHETGFIWAGHTPEVIEHIRQHEIYPSESNFVRLESAEDFRKTMPAGILTGDFPGWKGWLEKENAGWLHAQKAMVSAYNEAKKLGVHFITGSPEGDVRELVRDGQGQDIVGAKTADGIVHPGDQIIVTAGAGTDDLVDMQDQLRPTACKVFLTTIKKKEIKKSKG